MKDSATPLGAVRGLGSAGHGGGHWLKERFTSVALLLLGLWLIFSLAMLPSLDALTVKSWLSRPFAAVPMGLFVLAAFAHGLDGLKVVIDDYVHDDGTRIGLHFFLDLLAWGGAALALFSLAKIAFGA